MEIGQDANRAILIGGTVCLAITIGAGAASCYKLASIFSKQHKGKPITRGKNYDRYKRKKENRKERSKRAKQAEMQNDTQNPEAPQPPLAHASSSGQPNGADTPMNGKCNGEPKTSHQNAQIPEPPLSHVSSDSEASFKTFSETHYETPNETPNDTVDPTPNRSQEPSPSREPHKPEQCEEDEVNRYAVAADPADNVCPWEEWDLLAARKAAKEEARPFHVIKSKKKRGKKQTPRPLPNGTAKGTHEDSPTSKCQEPQHHETDKVDQQAVAAPSAPELQDTKHQETAEKVQQAVAADAADETSPGEKWDELTVLRAAKEDARPFQTVGPKKRHQTGGSNKERGKK